MATNNDFIVKNGLVVLAQGSVQSTSTETGAITTPGGVGLGGNLNVGGTGTFAGTLIARGIDLLAYDPDVWFVSEVGNDADDGRRIQSAFRTIEKALSVANPGDTVFIEAGTYEEETPLTVPQGVTVYGSGIRSTVIKPATGFETNNVFLLNGETTLSDFVITGHKSPGWAFRFATGAKITTKSPYIERVSVITYGTTTSTVDPYGFASADAGNGAYLDAGVLDPTSLEPAMLWNEVTMIVPNATAWYMTNGARAELLNGFSYFAAKAIQAEAGSTGYGGVGKTKLRLAGITGTFTAGDTITYKDGANNVKATGTISSATSDYVYIDGAAWGFEEITNRAGKTITPYGNAIQSTAQKKFGASSAYFDGTADYLYVGAVDDFNFTSTNYTAEAFVYSEDLAAGQKLIIDFRSTGAANNPYVYSNGTNLYFATSSTNRITGTGAIASTSTWYHVAVARSGNDTKLFVNGTQVGTTYTATEGFIESSVTIGANYGGTAGWKGYIDEVRVSKGVARYTTTFTPTSSAFVSDDATVLLLHMDGGNGSTVFLDDALGTQNVYSTGASPATATRIILADYHQFGAELRCIGSAAVFGTQGVVANGTGTDLKLIAFNMSHIGSGGDISNDSSKTVQANEVIQTNGGKIFFQTVDQNGDFRVGNNFLINQRTGNVTFGNATVNISSLTSLTITDGVNNNILLPTSISVGTLLFSGGTISSSAGSVTIAPSNNSTIISGALQATTETLIGTTNATSTTTGALVVGGGAGIGRDLWVGGNIYSSGGQLVGANAVTATNLANGALGSIPYQTAAGTTRFIDIGTNGKILISDGTTATWQVLSGTTSTFTISNGTDATSTASGALVVQGGAGIYENLWVGGQLNVSTSTFIVDNQSVRTSNKLIIVSSGTTVAANALDSGIQVGTSTPFVSFLFDGAGSWKSKGSIVPNGTANLGALTNNWNVIYGNTVYDNNNRVITTVTPAAGPGIAISNLFNSGPAAVFTVTNTGVLTVTAGTDTAVSTATGNVTVWVTATLQSVTSRGNSTDQQIFITNTTPASNANSGALQVDGGVGINGALYAGTIYENNARVWSTATLTDNAQLTNGAGYLTSSTLGLYGVSSINAGTGIALSQSTGSVTVTNIGVVSLTGTNYIGISAATGSNISITNLGVQTLTAGTDTAVSRSTGTVTVWDISTLQSVTQRGATTNQALAITATNLSASTSSGQALLVRGGIGALAVYASTLFDNGNRVLTSVTPTAGTGISVTSVTTSGVNTSFVINNTGVTATIGTTYLGVSSATGAVTFTNLGVQTLTAGTDTAVSRSTGTVTVWDVSTLQSVTGRGAITSNAIEITNLTNSTSTDTGALIVDGGAGIAKDLTVGGSVRIVGTLNASTVIGSISTSSNLAGGANGSIPYQTGAGLTSFIGIGAADTFLRSNGNTATWQTTASIHVAAAQYAVTATNINGGFVFATTGDFSGDVVITDETQSSNTTTGALIVKGGLGVGKNINADGNLTIKGNSTLTGTLQVLSAVTATGSISGVSGLFDAGRRVVTTVNPVAGPAIGISGLQSGGTTVTFTITNLGVQSLLGTNYIGISASTGSSITLTNLGVQTVAAGTDTAVSQNTGTVVIWNTANLQGITSRGASTDQAISISNTATSNTTTNGALVVAGGVGVGGNLNVGGNAVVRGDTTFGGNVTFNGTATFVYSTNTIYTDNILELHNPPLPATEWNTDDGKDIGLRLHYYNRTLGGSTDAALVLANDTQWLEWYERGAENIGGVITGTIAYGTFKTGQIRLVSATAATSTGTGALTVEGGVGIGEKLYVGGLIYSAGSQVVTAASLGNFGVAQIVGTTYIGVTPATGTGTVTITNLGVQRLTAGTGISVSANTGTITVSSVDTLQLVTSRGSSTTHISYFNNLSGASSTNTGALQVMGGIGVAGNIYVGGASTFLNGITGVITTATNLAAGTAGAIPYQSAAGTTGFVSLGLSGTLLASNGTTPQYVTTQSLLVGYAVTSTFASEILGGTAGQLLYQSAPNVTNFLSTGTGGYVLVSRPGAPVFENTLTLSGTVAATSTLTGALRVSGGAGIGGDLYVGGDIYSKGNPVVTSANLGLYGVSYIQAGVDIGVSANTGTVTINNTSTLQTVTNRGSTTTNAIKISNASLGSTTASGQALLVGGGIGALALYADFVYDGGNRVLTRVSPAGGPGITISNVSTGSGNTNFTINNSGVTATIGTTYLGVSGLTGAVTFTNLGVQTLTAGTDTAVSRSTGTVTVWSTASLQSVTDRGSTTTNALRITNTTVSTSTVTGALIVDGGVGIGGSTWIYGNLTVNGLITGNVNLSGTITTSSNIALGTAGQLLYQSAPGVTAFAGPGTAGQILLSNGTSGPVYTNTASIYVNSSVFAEDLRGGTNGQLVYQSAANTTAFLSTGTAGQLLMSQPGAPAFVNTSNVYVNSSVYAEDIRGGTPGQLLYQSAANTTGYVGPGIQGQVLVSGGTGSPVYQNTLTLAGTVNATSTISGALNVAGGVGIGRDLYVGGTIYATGIQGSITTATNVAGGAAGSLHVQTAVGVTGFVSIGAQGTLLASNGTAPIYISTTTLLVGYALTSNATSNLNGGTAGQVPYQSAPNTTAFYGPGNAGEIAVSRGNTGSPLYQNTLTLAGTTAAINTTSGALQVRGGIGIGGDATFGGRVSVNTGTLNTSYQLFVNGSFAATTKSFVIPHPTKPGKMLRYGSLEGPENGVYVRGRLTGSNTIELPDYWTKLIDPATITVDLTPIGQHQKLYVKDIVDNKVIVGNENLFSKEINCFYTVWAERCDVEKLGVEID